MKTPNFILVASFCFLFVSCQKEAMITRTQSYLDLLSYYDSDVHFVKADKNRDRTILSFEGAAPVTIANGEFEVHDCTILKPSIPETRESSGTWIVDGKDTRIPFSAGASLEDSYPVYAYFNRFMFCMYASNGECLKMFVNEDHPLRQFSFLRKYNPLLDFDIDFDIDEESVTGHMSLDGSGTKLSPTFSINADCVTVGGEIQTSSISVQDFSTPIVYTVHKHNGETLDYTVSLTIEKDIPTIRITTKGNAIINSRTEYVQGHIVCEDYSGIYSEVKSIESDMKIRGRGNSTWNFVDKRPYRIKLSNSSELFGIHKDKDWDLLAEYSDKTLLRNRTGMELSRICEMDWTPRMISVHLFLNGEYKGVYTLSEHKEVDEHKVNIEVVGENDNSGEALTGGYYLEIDTSQDDPVHFYTEVGIPIMFSDPEEPTEAQENYIRKYLDDFEKVLYSDDFSNPDKGYAAYVDVDSFINFYIIEELSKNIDGNLAKSCFLSKERGEKLRFCHVWDFDLAFGNCDYINASFEGATNGPEDWFICKYIAGDYYTRGSSPGWFGRMLQDPGFVAALQARWDELYPQLCNVPDFIDRCVEDLYGAQDDNFRVHKILGKYVWPNQKVCYTYAEEILFLKTFYSQRLNWMNSAIRNL